MSSLSLKVGGQQGEGIESTGEILSIALNRIGYHIYGYRHFSSRIKGGHTNNKIRVSTTPVYTPTDEVDILVAFDQETIDLNHFELSEHSLILADEKFSPALPVGCSAQLIVVPFSKIASTIGNAIMKNIVAIGATVAVLEIDLSEFDSVIRVFFGKKGSGVVDQNITAIKLGYDFIKNVFHTPMKKRLGEALASSRLLMTGNEALALGFIAGGVRFIAGYPITPASEVMEYLSKKLPEIGGVAIQVEDEIAAVTMTIGANYGGVRAVTATSGPGFSLMTEGIGLAGMTETPLVVVNSQRGGPSTGLPTKQEDADLFAAIYGTHGEIPKVVLAPSTIEDAFIFATEALNIAEAYQCPVIILSDFQLALSKQSVGRPALDKVEIKRGKLVTTVGENYQRYEPAVDGISSRTIPGVRNGEHFVTGVEHNELGLPNEKHQNRVVQMDKRLRKLNNFTFKNAIYKKDYHENCELLLVGAFSTFGAIGEVTKRLNDEGVKANHLHIKQLHPFPVGEIKDIFTKALKVVVVDNNATSQLANLIKQNIGFHEKISTINKYDGNPFLPNELLSKVKGMN